METEPTVTCLKCGHDVKGLDECPQCGGRDKALGCTAQVRLFAQIKLRVQDFLKTHKKFFLEYIKGWDWWRDAKKMVFKFRKTDKENDYYRELIIDPDTGKVLRNCSQKLSEHHGKTKQ